MTKGRRTAGNGDARRCTFACRGSERVGSYAASAELLLQRIADPEKVVRRVVLRGELVVRASSGA